MLFSAVITPMICTPVGGDGTGRCDVDELGNGRRQGDGYTRNITVVGRRWMKRMVLEDFCFFSTENVCFQTATYALCSHTQ